MDKPKESKALLATSIIGLPVKNSERQNLGKIDDFVLDMESGRIAYAVMSSTSRSEAGERLFAVPIQSMILDIEREEFVLDADKSRLDDAPGFDRDNWPRMGDRRWGAKIHAYYGQKPYWE
jgi:sporulation protein YlmC with PRC-barrel domain